MAASASPQLAIITRWEGLLVSEYSQDRLNRRIKDLEKEILTLHKKIMLYQDMEKDRVMVEGAVFVVGLLTRISRRFLCKLVMVKNTKNLDAIASDLLTARSAG
jgi:hypothetical protein